MTKKTSKTAALKVETVSLTGLELDPRNARRHPDGNLESIKSSLTRFGQQKPIVVDADGVVVAGNGTFAAATALGWKTINVVRAAIEAAKQVKAETGVEVHWRDVYNRAVPKGGQVINTVEEENTIGGRKRAAGETGKR